MCAKQLVPVFLLISLSYSSYQLAISDETDYQRKSLYSINCTEDRHCLVNSYCHLGRCACKDGYLPDKDTRKGPVKCIKQIFELEDYCEKDIQCQSTFGPHAICQKADPKNSIGKCNCSNDAHFIDNYCYKTAYIGQRCVSNDNCLIRSRNIMAHCQYSVCICPPLHHPIDSGRDCVPTSVLGGPCLTSDSCITLNAECKHFLTGGFCLCQNGYINNPDNSSCLQVAMRLGDSCVEEKQCNLNLKNSKCNLDDATCACIEGYHEADGECRPTRYLFEKCDHSMECMNGYHPGRGIHCLDRICQCMEGYEIDERKYCTEIEISTPETSDNGGSLPQKSFYFLIGIFILTSIRIL